MLNLLRRRIGDLTKKIRNTIDNINMETIDKLIDKVTGSNLTTQFELIEKAWSLQK